MKPTIHLIDVTDFELPDGTKSSDWFEGAFKKLGIDAEFELEVYDGTETIFPELNELSDCGHGIIVSGSSGAVFEEKLWIPPLLQFLKDAHSRNIWMLGVCFGHHALAEALGGKVEANPRGREMGTTTVYLTDEGLSDPILEGFGQPEFVNLTHKTQVTRLPDGAVRLAFNQMTPVQAFRLNRSIGVQFHPEITPVQLRQLAEMFKSVLIRKERFLDDEEHLRDFFLTFRETPASMNVLANFVRLIAH